MKSKIDTDLDFKYNTAAQLKKDGTFSTEFELKEPTDIMVKGEPGRYLIQILQNGKVVAVSNALQPNERIQAQPSIRAILD